tara:strand:- start:68 stop:271 length:204 start_codon:yes stop_codon:yes gene_type:complete
MSTTTPSVMELSAAAPVALAAGPDKMVSMGLAFTKSEETRDPSPRMTIKGQAIFSRTIEFSTAVINW